MAATISKNLRSPSVRVACLLEYYQGMRRLFIAVLTVFGVFAAMPQILRAWTPTAANATVSVFGGSSIEASTGIAVDASGNMYVTGDFLGTADFDPGAGTANLTPVGGTNAFVVKLDASGTYVYIRDDALELSLSSAYADKLLVDKALSYIYKQSSLRRWAITESISSSYPSGCVAQRNDFVFEKGQVWNWFRNTPGWSRNCDVRLRKETIGVQTKTIRLRWTYPTVSVEANCDVNLNQFNEPELSYLRLVIVVEN